MVAIKAALINRLLSHPENYDAYLIFGQDQGLVTERGAKLAQSLASKTNGPTEQIKILNDDLSTSPERLALDLKTISMFGERKILRLSAGKDLSLPGLESLLKEAPFEADLIIEAGDLKKTAKLRKIFENNKNTASIACYTDTTSALNELISEVFKKNNLTIDRATQNHLVSKLGADRALSRNEVEKLALYVQCPQQDQQEVSIADIDTILGDMSQITIEEIISATLLGAPQIALNQLRRALETGINSTPIFLSLMRQLHQLHKGALSVAGGQTIHAVAQAQRPPLYFERRDNFIKQLNFWKEDHLAKAMQKTQETMGQARARGNPALEASQLEALLLSLSNFAKQKRS